MKIAAIFRKDKIFNSEKWRISQLKKAAREFKIELVITDIENLNYDLDVLSNVDKIIWFSSSLTRRVEKPVFYAYFRERIMNNCLWEFPFVPQKFFQQRYLSYFTDLNTIPTYYFKNKKELFKAIEREKILQYPFIMKPNIGSQGDNVRLVESFNQLKKEKIDFKVRVFQNFIKNDGDYRVFLVKGKPVGVMKRKAEKGGFLNNVSKGGTVSLVKDDRVRKKLIEIAKKVVEVFKLDFVGVDIVLDKNSGKYLFLELNTTPQWRGLQEITGRFIAKDILEACLD